VTAEHDTGERAGAAGEHPPAENAGGAGRDIREHDREKSRGERIEDQGRHHQRHAGRDPAIVGDAKPAAQPARDRGKQHEADRKERDRRRAGDRVQQELTAQAQHDCPDRPERGAPENETRVYIDIMRMRIHVRIIAVRGNIAAVRRVSASGLPCRR